LALICFFILYRIAGLFLVRHLDVAGKQSFFDNQESRAKRFHPLFLAACAAFFLGCSLYFATFIPVAYKNYVYYREQITPLEPASAPKPAAEPVKPSAEYLQWMKDNNLTEDHMKGFASGLYDYAQNEKAHNLVMAKDSFYSLMLSPILPLLMLVMGCVCAFWTRLSWDAYR
jgi:hypothetical protein